MCVCVCVCVYLSIYIYRYIYPGQVVDWDPKSKRKGAPQAHETTHAKAVCLSQCGNYGVVGYSCGRIDKYNMQVGLAAADEPAACACTRRRRWSSAAALCGRIRGV